ncbi:MAG TPA: PilT/PilU family type 4a pilus ATPase [Polyangiaceae bacterium]|nr:PilT/PilU family type 4a pilus ATPase [Polyangiaceae bacterium]
MPAIDSILTIAVQQGATELSLGTDREPGMFRHGSKLRLSLEETSDETLRHLLGSLLTPERELATSNGGVAEFHYESSAGTFEVELTGRDDGSGLDVVFHRGARKAQGACPEAGRPMDDATAATAAPVHAPSAFCFAAPLASATGALPDDPLSGLLRHAVSVRASDLHLCEGDVPAVRIDGRLHAMLSEPLVGLAALLGGVIPGGFGGILASGKSIDTAFDLPGSGRFRLNAYVAQGRPCASIRILPDAPPPLVHLQLPVALEDLAELPHGLVIVCGPTGAGKTTTLASLAQEVLRRRSVVLITLEDPVEYRMRPGPRGSLVRQREIGRDVRDFPTGLRDALREDPDVLLIGEMRDAESVGLTLTAAETGHLVLASLHSRSAASAIDRIVDSSPAAAQQQIRIQLAECLRAVVSQRLLPRADGDGQVAAMEMLRVNHGVASLIREGRTAQIATAQQAGRKEGQLPLERCLADLVRAGRVRLEDARAVANDVQALASYLHG